MSRSCTNARLTESRLLVTDASDDDLLGAMAKKHEDLALARAALEKFMRRHVKFVYRACSNLVDRYGTASGWNHEEFSHEVFERVYKKAHTYRPVAALTAAGKLRRLKGWIGRITNNLLIDKHRRCRVLVFDDEFLKAVESPLEQSDFPDQTQKLLCAAIQKLPDKERLVYVRTLRYLEAGKRGRLPNQVSRALRDELQTTAANVRKLRQKAKEKVVSYMEANGADASGISKLG